MMKSLRSDENFNELWGYILKSRNKRDVKKPKLRNIRKILKSVDDAAQPAAFNDPSNYYKKTYGRTARRYV